MRISRFWPLCVLLAVAGCQWVPAVPGVSPHKIDIQQGNALGPEVLSRLRLGMTRSQVRFALGTPLLVDPFRTDRWDYVFSLDQRGRRVERRHIAVIFEGDRLVRVEGDVPPEILTEINSGVSSALPVLPPPATPVAPPPAVAPAAPPATPPTPGAGVQPPPAEPVPGSNLVTGGAVGAQSGPADGKPPAQKPAAPAPASQPEEKGFFGRMLDTLGF